MGRSQSRRLAFYTSTTSSTVKHFRSPSSNPSHSTGDSITPHPEHCAKSLSVSGVKSSPHKTHVRSIIFYSLLRVRLCHWTRFRKLAILTEAYTCLVHHTFVYTNTLWTAITPPANNLTTLTTL